MSNTITIPKTEYQKLWQIEQYYYIIRQIVGSDYFEKPPTKDIKKIIEEFHRTGLYREEFLSSLETGLEESSYFSRQRLH